MVDASLENRCLDALREAWRLGIKSPRSPGKLDVLHGWIRQELLRDLEGYQVYGKTTEAGPHNKECTEAANLRGQRLVYGNVIFMPHPIPVNSGGTKSEERVTDASLDRYRKLVTDHESIVVPDVQAIVVAKLSRQTGELSRLATPEDLSHLGRASLDFLFNQVHIAKFIRDYAAKVAWPTRS